MSALVNAARGEVALSIDGRARRLCLTLGALAELETAFAQPSLGALAQRLSRLSASDLLIVLEALLRGGGEPMSRAELAHARLDPAEAARAVGQAFRLALGDG